MLIWLLCAVVVTSATGFYLSRAGVEKPEIYKAVAACLLLIAVGAVGIESAMHALPADQMGGGISVAAEQIGLTENE